jgi:hypothetical protein
MLGKGARLVRFQDSKKSEWRVMLRRKKPEGAVYSPLYVRLAWTVRLPGSQKSNRSPGMLRQKRRSVLMLTYAFLLATTKFSLAGA